MANVKEKEKQLQDKIQIILSDLLKDDDNKYCVDCDGKGPRWASWTLGIFLCIRCAGIHRNLGVHITRVKSVNLDSWTPQQVAMMKEIGNSRGRAIYEANLDDNFRRPQTDTTLEQFIRAKYEHKRYIAKEWIPPNPSADSIADDIRKLEHNLHKKRSNYPTVNSSVSVSRKDADSHVARPEITKTENTNNKVDLLGLDNGVNDDTFGDFVFVSQTNLSNTATNHAVAPPVSSAVDDLMGLNLGNNAVSTQSCVGTVMYNAPSSSSTVSASAGLLDKNSILALYNNNGTASSMVQVPSSAWPGIGVPNYQGNMTQPDVLPQSQQFYGAAQWTNNASMPQVGAFGAQHNPFFNNSAFPVQHQAVFPAATAGQTQQLPNSILW